MRAVRPVVRGLAALTVVAGCGSGHGNPDPHGTRLNAIKTLLAVLPSDASVSATADSEPNWDQCTAGSGSGYDPIAISRTFTSPSSVQVVVRRAKQSAASAGWQLASATTSGLLALTWQRTVVIDGTKVSLRGSLSQFEVSPTHIEWSLYASAPPKVHALGDC